MFGKSKEQLRKEDQKEMEEKKHEFKIHLFDKYPLIAHDVPGTVPDPETAVMGTVGISPSSGSLHCSQRKEVLLNRPG